MTTLDDLMRRFGVLPFGDGPSRTVRGTMLAVAQDWLVRLPAGKDRDQAIECLAEAADLACEALTSTAR